MLLCPLDVIELSCRLMINFDGLDCWHFWCEAWGLGWVPQFLRFSACQLRSVTAFRQRMRTQSWAKTPLFRMNVTNPVSSTSSLMLRTTDWIKSSGQNANLVWMVLETCVPTSSSRSFKATLNVLYSDSPVIPVDVEIPCQFHCPLCSNYHFNCFVNRCPDSVGQRSWFLDFDISLWFKKASLTSLLDLSLFKVLTVKSRAVWSIVNLIL